jgi:hypothetical protein
MYAKYAIFYWKLAWNFAILGTVWESLYLPLFCSNVLHHFMGDSILGFESWIKFCNELLEAFGTDLS